ncbi:MAG: acetylglutamate kinase [Oscillospiraceae bacterium]|jgi:acetylglutamate kinase|nr:acetylglutamate kinase [Oscillospiraceae bacterium]
MEISNSQRAQVLIEALPYIQRYEGKIVVVKYGGNAMINEELKKAVMSDLVLLHMVGINVVLVHGGGPEINDMLDKLGKESKFVNGLRYTDEETIDVVQMVLAGKVNKSLVKHLSELGGNALGLCGLDNNMLVAKKLSSEEDLGFVGEITKVNEKIISDSIESGYIPVISTIAVGENGEVYNINADLAAAQIAAKLHAVKLLMMTDIRGLLRDVSDESTIINDVKVSDVPRLKSSGIIKGGMIPKIDCCVEAVRRGVECANIIDGRVPHSILIEMLTDEGFGTMFH